MVDMECLDCRYLEDLHHRYNRNNPKFVVHVVKVQHFEMVFDRNSMDAVVFDPN